MSIAAFTPIYEPPIPIIITFLIPGINMDDLSNRSQVSMVKKYISSDNNIIYGADLLNSNDVIKLVRGDK